MKNLLHFLLFFVSNCIWINSDSQTVSWIKKGISPGFENGNAVVADDSGNVYVTGQTEYSAVFDNYVLPSNGIHDIVIAKYDSNGTIKWIRNIGGIDGDIGLGIGIDEKHNVYVSGEIEETVVFGPGITLTSTGGNDCFIAKFDISGNTVWAKRFGNASSSDKSRAIAVSPSGNSYITGNFSSSMSIGSTNLSGYGGNDIFIAKFDTHGNLSWAKRAGGSKQDRGYGIAIDASENVYVTGSFTSPATFKSTTLTNSAKMSSFLAKYNSSGSFQWAKAGGTCCDTTESNSIALDNSGNIFIAGWFAGQTKFSSYSMTSTGLKDIFLTKYNSSGSVQWTKKAGGVTEDIAYGIAINSSISRLYLTGFVSSAGTSGSISYPFVGYKDMILACFSTNSGSTKWVKTYGGPWRDIGLAVNVNSQGNIYATGLFNGTAYFGPYTITGYPNQPWADFFVTKISPPVPTIRQSDELISNEENISPSYAGSFLFDVKVFPNPFHENFIINSALPVSYKIYDENGKITEEKNYLSGEITVGENLSKGLYYLVLTSGNEIKTIRIVKSE